MTDIEKNIVKLFRDGKTYSEILRLSGATYYRLQNVIAQYIGNDDIIQRSINGGHVKMKSYDYVLNNSKTEVPENIKISINLIDYCCLQFLRERIDKHKNNAHDCIE